MTNNTYSIFHKGMALGTGKYRRDGPAENAGGCK